MASSYSDLKIELIATGEQSGTWGSTTNTNLGTALQEAITGRANADFSSDADLTLGYTDSNAAQVFRNLILNVTSTGSLTATRNLVVPTIEKQYLVENNTTGGQSIVVKTSAGTGITVPNGAKAHLYADGTNVVQASNYFATVDIDGGTIDGADVTVGAGKTLDVSAGTFTVANDQISGDAINGGTIGSVTISQLAGALDANNQAITNVDINSGAIDGATIGANSAAAGTFTQVDIEAQGNLRLQDTTGGEYVGLRAPGTVPASYTLTMPTADGSNGQVLVTDGSGTLSFSDSSGGITTGKAIAMAIVFG